MFRVVGRNSSIRTTMCALVLIAARTAVAQTPNRPQAVAVHNGDIVMTSMGTDFVSVLRDGETTPETIDVGAPSWGVCFAGSKAYITMPRLDEIAVLDLSSPSTIDVETPLAVKRGCTEIISDEAGEILYVANYGASPATPGSEYDWQNSYLRIGLSSPSTYDEYATERQPRALALSPGGSRLFIGTVQGALGKAGIIASYTATGFTDTYDGGSILVHDTSDGSVEYRIAVGSPVRGLAVIDGTIYDTSNSGDYRIYFSHVGEGVHSEDPGQGGRLIPNVLSSIRMSSSHVPQERQDTIFRHDAEHEPSSSAENEDLPAVLPERIAVRNTSTVSGYEAELWVTNSASGTVSRAWVNPGTGAIATSGTQQLTLPIVTSVQADTFGFTLGTRNVTYGLISPQDHVRTDSESEAFRSQPRGIVYDPDDDRFIVCTLFFGDLLAIDASQATLPTSAPSPLATGTRITAWPSFVGGEGNFFTFGGGFDFRETSNSLKINNTSCATCHVDGHHDGKARLTIRFSQAQTANPSERRMVTAVPSVRDTQGSEWIFFEGQRTVLDIGSLDGVTRVCSYCDLAEFFGNTTHASASPSTSASPHVEPTSSLTASARRGRAWFDDLNCSRCHGGRSESFQRTREDDPGVTPVGPFNFGDGLLSDPTQSFISFLAAIPGPDDSNSIRNMSNVGTRISASGVTINPAGESIVPGVNTPALAGAWDNRPYFHDGRYRTLSEVLSHTWVQSSLGDRAVRVWGAAGVPDNFLDDESHPILPAQSGGVAPLTINFTTAELFIGTEEVFAKEFKTHAHADPDGTGTGWISAKDYLEFNSAYDDVLEFILSLSSELDPYPSSEPADPAITNLAVADPKGPVATISWTTAHTAVSRITITNDVDETEYFEILGPGVTSYEADVSVPANWTAVVSTAYNGEIDTESITWPSYDAQFANRSDDSQIGDSFTDQPYDAKAIDYDDDGRPDLLISNDSGTGVLLLNQMQSEQELRDVPQFIEKNDVGFPSGQEPASTRGIALADMDIDGDLDAFLAAETKANVRLYRNKGSASPWFEEISSTTGLGSTVAVDSLAIDSWTAAWGDVDRDGRPDLFLGRGDTASGEPSGALADRLLRNVKSSGTLRFVDISSTAQINAAGNRTTVTASFGELGGELGDDKAPELLVGDAGTAGSVLYRFASFNSSGLPVYTYQNGIPEPHLKVINPYNYQSVAGSTWADMDSDGDLDLVLTKHIATGNNTLIVWGDGEGEFTETVLPFVTGIPISAPLVTDLDFSGSVDLLLAPAVDDSQLLLLSNFIPSQHASSFEDVTHHVGLDDADSKISTVVAADFSGADGDLDGDFDLYLGRTAAAPDETPSTNTSSVYYRSGEGIGSSDDAPRNRWLGIKPRWPAGTGVEWSVIGTIVVIDLPAGTSSPALTTAKIVNSDGNRAAEALGELRFGLGLAEGPATITIRWPDGKSQTETIDDEDFNQTHTIDAAHHPDVSSATGFTPTATYEVLGIGQAKWVITWYTDYACDPTLDMAVVTRTSGSCTSSKTLTPTTSGVTHSVIPVTGGRYKHTMTYQTATCGPCTYDVDVTSKVSTREDTGETTLTMSTCGQFEG